MFYFTYDRARGVATISRLLLVSLCRINFVDVKLLNARILEIENLNHELKINRTQNIRCAR
jgi:hypothetical protein